MSDDTRDIAVEAKSLVNQHMTDCMAFRITVQSTLAEFRDDLKSLNWRMALIVGGITALGEIVHVAFGK